MRNWLVPLKMTSLSTNLSTNLVDEPVEELGGEPADEQVELQEDEQPEQDLHAAEIMLRRVHANLGHPRKGFDVTSPS